MNKIYKYVIADRIDILEHCQLRITQPKYLNDPFDSVLSFKKVVEKELFLDHFNSEKSFENIISNFAKVIESDNKKFGTNYSLDSFLAEQGKSLEQFKNHFTSLIGNFIDSFTDENPEIKNLFNEEISKFLGIISFTESPDNIPMWAYYADVYQGFVIVFNSEHKFFNNGLLTDPDFGSLHKINYPPEKTVLDSLKEFKSNSFFEKHIRWKNEEEWRLILPLSLAHTIMFPDIYLINIPPEIITGVIFGFRCNPQLIDYVRQLKTKNNIWKHLELSIAIPHSDSYKMKIKNI